MSEQDTHERDTAPSVSASSPAELFGTPKLADPAGEPVKEEPKTDVEPVKESEKKEEPVEEPEKKEPEKEEPEKVVAEPERFKLWDGRELTADEIARNPELLKDLIVTRQQFPHIQKKYTDLLEESRKPKEEPAKPDKEEPPKKPQTLEEWQGSLKPVVERLKSGGVITDDDINFAPGLVNLVAHLTQEHEQLKRTTMATYEREIRPFVEIIKKVQENAEREGFLSKLNRDLGTLSAQAEFFNSLSQQDHREQFIKHLNEKVNPDVTIIMGDNAVEFLAGEYVAWQREPLLKAVSEASKKKTAAASTASSAGEGTSASPGKPAKKRNQDILDLFSA